jgi:hypothetical protein
VAVGLNHAVRGPGWPEEPEGSLAKVCNVLLEVRAGPSPWNGGGEVLEPHLQGAGQGQVYALAGEPEGLREVDEALDFVANLLSLAGKKVTFQL